MIIDNNNLDGVARKLLFQCDALASVESQDKMYLASFFSEDYYAVKGIDYEKEIKFENKNSKQLNMFQIYPKLPEICEELCVQAVYFRVMALSWVTNRLFRELKKQGIRIVIEIPTYPFWKEKWMDVIECIKSGKVSKGLKRGGTNVVYWVYAHKLREYIKAIVTFSNIDHLWGVKVIGIANGYHFELPKIEKKLKTIDDTLNLLMVASIRDNHGTDRVIQGMSDYYKQGGSRKLIFHIVGEGEAIPKLKALVNERDNVKEKVIFHGFKSGKQLEEMYEISDIGVSALGFHRIGVYYCSPLKSKEYFAKGLPIIGTTAEKDILETKCKTFYFDVPEDDSSIDFKKVIEFYDSLRENDTTNLDIVKTASQYFDWKYIMRPIYNILVGRM